MSLREKAREVKEAGEAERGTFAAEGAPKRAYDYWLRNTKSNKGEDIRNGERKENFCHFWRVVMIWAPLWFAANTFESIITNPVFVFGMIATAIFSTIYLGLVFESFAVALGLILLGVVTLGAIIWGGASGVALTMEDDYARERAVLPAGKWMVAGAVVGFPAALVTFIFTTIKNAWTKEWTDVLLGVMVVVLVGLAVALLVGLVMSEGVMGLLVVLGIILAVGLAMLVTGLALFALGDFIKGRRAVRKKRAREAREEYYEKHGHFPGEAPREPGRIERFFIGLGDFIVLAVNVVRVKKWKICPIVEVDTNKAA